MEFGGTVSGTSCETCYIEFYSTETSDGAFNGKMSNDMSSNIPFIWGTGEDGKIYVMMDLVLEANIETSSKLVLDSGIFRWVYRKE